MKINKDGFEIETEELFLILALIGFIVAFLNT